MDCKEVKENYVEYLRILKEDKFCKDGVEIMQQKSNHQKMICSNTPIQDDKGDDKYRLYSSINEYEDGKFSFAIFCDKFSHFPIIRYDSKGHPHKNYQEDKSICEEKVSTPHFHLYDKEGRLYAYKTKELMNKDSLKELSNASNCIFHFFDQANVRYGKFRLTSQPKLELKCEREIDPIAGVSYGKNE